MMETDHEYSLLEDIEKQTWFSNSGASHHLTPYAYFLHTKKPYASYNSICVVNDQSLAINCVESSCVISKSRHIIPLVLKDILYVPCITRNLLTFTILSKDNRVMFEFIADKFYVKSQVSKLTFLEGYLNQISCIAFLNF